jgi:ABC-type Fe3+-hydroxamate transport system substrate-binding protein
MRIYGLLSLPFALILGACGQQADDTEPSAETQPSASPATESALPQMQTLRPAPEGAVAYIISPTEGDVVDSPVRVAFGLKGIGVAPAGVDLPATGHHHLLVDAELISLDSMIPTDNNHLHYGLGQTEAIVELEPGEHRLQLVLGDYLHTPHDPPVVSDVVTIQVQ